jgi:hypothetical protein
MDLSPEIVIVSGDKFILIIRPVFGEYYKYRGETLYFLSVVLQTVIFMIHVCANRGQRLTGKVSSFCKFFVSWFVSRGVVGF